MFVMWRRRRGTLTLSDNAFLCCGCAAAELEAPLQKAVLEERGGVVSLPAGQHGCTTGIVSLREGTLVGYEPETLVLLSSFNEWSNTEKRQKTAEPPLGEWNGKGVWAWLSLVSAGLETPLPVASDFQMALVTVFLQHFDIAARLGKMCL